jgi:hypothetical protein
MTAMSNWYIGIRVERSEIDIDVSRLKDLDLPFVLQNFGHVMVTITDPNGNTEVFGWMPDPSKAASNRNTVPGYVKLDQRDHVWDFEKRIAASVEQVESVKSYVQELTSIKSTEAPKGSDEQTLRYYASPVAASILSTTGFIENAFDGPVSRNLPIHLLLYCPRG